MTVCSMFNERYASLSGARVQVVLSPFEGSQEITMCRQCAKPKCAEACPEAAISRHAEHYMTIDYERCTACRDCIAACPFQAMFWNPISGKVIKCELCHGDPQCVEACPTGALSLRLIPLRNVGERE
jgi:Fe-S-cluster-containing hydrogenase component 2